MKYFAYILLFSVHVVSYSQSVEIDSTFGNSGFVYFDINQGNEKAYDMVLQPDGKAIIGGIKNFGTDKEIIVIRLNPDGSLDYSFADNGLFTNPSFYYNSELTLDLDLQQDGKIVLASSIDPPSGDDSDFLIIRINANGIIDSSFGTNGSAIIPIGGDIDISNSVKIQPDGKIIVVGTSKNWPVNLFAISRLNSDGSLDSSFGNGGFITYSINSSYGASNILNDLAIQSDGKIICIGNTIFNDGIDRSRWAIIRLNNDGTLDQGFGDSGLIEQQLRDPSDIPGNNWDQAQSTAIQQDGKIVVGGTSYLNGYGGFAFMRFNSDGSLDSTFSNNGIKIIDAPPIPYLIEEIGIDEYGNIIAVGHDQFTIIGLDSYGNQYFNLNSQDVGLSGSYASSMAIQDDGKIFVSGPAYTINNNWDFVVCRYQQLNLSHSIWYISTSGSDLTGTGSESSPFATIQRGINAASDGDTILVYPGTYVENINFNGKNIVVGSLFLTTEDTSYISSTIIDGNQNGSVVTFESGESNVSQFIGFSLINGSTVSGFADGSAIHIDNSSPGLNRLIIRDNTDGAIGCYNNSSPLLDQLTINNNINGRGITCQWNSNPVIKNTLIYNNVSGGVYLESNCNPIIMNSTIAENDNIGIYIEDNSNPVIINSILWNNDQEILFSDLDQFNNISVAYSDLNGGQTSIIGSNGHINWLNGNIDFYPQFVDSANGDYRINDYSPCIGAGADSVEINGTWYYSPTTDIEGNPRPDPTGSMPDMGAYENQRSIPESQTYTVKIDGTGNFTTIQSAINSVFNDGDTILVYPGTYVENINFNGKNIVVGSLFLTTQDTSYISSTIIDGNQNGSVVTIEDINSPTNLLTGFTIVNGDSGGVKIRNSNIILDQLVVRNNIAALGGGIYINNSTLNVINTLVRYNFSSGDGGGIYGINSSIDINNTTIDSNSAGTGVGDIPECYGGGIFIKSSSFDISNSIVSNNLSSEGGGGLAFRDDSIYTVVNCSIINNNTDYGGGIYIDDFSPYNTEIIIDSTFIAGNFSTGSGGGIYSHAYVNGLISKSVIVYNSSNYGGGIIFNNNSSWDIVNCTIFGDTASTGGGMAVDDSNINITNSILWNNVSNELFIYGGSSINTNYSDIEGYNSDESGNFGFDPMFIDPDNSDFSLLQISPCIDAGNPDLDGDGLTWETDPDDQDPDGTRMDIGAFYFDQSDFYRGPIWYVSPEGVDFIGGGNESSPFASIQYAINNSINGDTVLVYPGIYVENINFNGKNIVVGSLFLTTEDTSYISSTIIDGNQNGSVVTFESGEDSAANFIGFTIRNGNSEKGGGIYCLNSNPILTNLIISNNIANTGEGGGIYGWNSNISLVRSIIDSNTSVSNSGGGIYLKHATISIDSSVISNNISGNNGGGGICAVDSSRAYIFNSQIISNNANNGAGDGGGIFSSISTFTLQNVIIQANHAMESGGGILEQSSTGQWKLKNVIIANNIADIRGGGAWFNGDIYTDSVNAIITNCTIVENTSGVEGGGIIAMGGVDLIIVNTVIYFNNPDPIAFYTDPNGSIYIYYSNIENGMDGIVGDVDHITWGPNINLDPSFVSLNNNNYELFPDSPCIGTGIDSVEINNNWYFAPVIDIAGNPRPNPVGSNPDIGAYEHSRSEPEPRLYSVKLDGTGDFTTIQTAVGAIVGDGDTILVYPGVYIGNVTIGWSKNIVLASLYLTTHDTSFISSTIIDANHDGPVITFYVGQDSTTQVIGFTITNGFEGGILVIDSSPTISYNKIIGNYQNQGWGGGIFCERSSSLISNNIVKNNIATMGGGGISINGLDTPIIKHNIIEGNHCLSNGYGGGIFFYQATPFIISNNLIYNNQADYGGGVSFQSGQSSNNMFFNNNTIVDNSAQYGGAVYIQNDTIEIHNTIIWRNTATIQDSSVNLDNALLNCTYSDIDNAEGASWLGEGSIDIDPLFIAPDVGDYHLQWGSPCIDTGDPDSPLDPNGTRADMGAFYFGQGDSLPPYLYITDLSSINIGTSDSLIVTWQSSDNWLLDSAFVDFLYSDSSIWRMDTTLAETGQASIAVPDSTLDSFRVIITAWDYNHNEARDTSDVITVYDNIRPVVTVTFPEEGFSIPENEVLTVSWIATDNIELDSVAIYYGVNQGGHLMGIVPKDSTRFTFSVPPGVTDSGVVRVVARDIFMNFGENDSPLFTVSDNTRPFIEWIDPDSGAGFDIGTTALLRWNAQDNVGVVSVDLDFSTNNGVDWTTIASNLEGSTDSYEWQVPNRPADSVQIRAIAGDQVGLSDTAVVGNLSIQIVYPTVVSVDPPPGYFDWSNRRIRVMFSQKMAPPISLGFISNYSGSMFDDTQISYTDTNTTLLLTLSSSFAAMDTMNITLLGHTFQNIYGYYLDGNGDGEGGDDFSFQYTTGMLADFDTSNTIDVMDLAAFIQTLDHHDFSRELGPVTGTVPHFISTPDSALDIEDVMAFVMMWNWYVTTQDTVFHQWVDYGNEIPMETTPDSIIISLPENSMAVELMVKYDPAKLAIRPVDHNSPLHLINTNPEKGLYTFLSKVDREQKIAIPIEIRGKSADINLSVKAVGPNREVLSQTTQQMNLVSIPKEFALEQNFPNPFNPVTTIHYSLPIDGLVTLTVYNLRGREVIRLVDRKQTPGYKSVQWDGRNASGQPVSTGMYFYAIHAGKYSAIRKMVLLK